MKRIPLFVLAILMVYSMIGWGDVVINELNYDPVDQGDEGGGLREFIEIYNPGPDAINLSGYALTNGVTYPFPQDTILGAGTYLIVARVPTHRTWRNKSYPVLGPFDGKLSNGGERLTLQRPDGTQVENFRYDDDSPWPRGADGYGLHTRTDRMGPSCGGFSLLARLAS